MADYLTREQFLVAVAKHEMVTLRDDGLYRHLRFRNPDTSNQYFDLITWPGYLAWVGDMGDFVFKRNQDDMFGFFGTDAPKEVGSINPAYWAEKIIAAERNGATEFDPESFVRKAKEYLVEWMRANRNDTTKEDRRELWDDVLDSVIEIDDCDSGARRIPALLDYRARIGGLGFEFRDAFEWHFDKYRYEYIWACHAIQWGVSVYDEAKEKVAA